MFSEFRFILFLALPLIANGLLESSYGFFNTFLVAHLNQQALAAAGLVNMLFTTLMIISWGMISANSILISHYHGAENKLAIRGVLRDGFYLSLITSVPIMAICWFAPDFFEWTGQSALIVQESRKYLHALLWCIPFNLAGLAFLQLFQGISRTRVNFWLSILSMPFILLINYIFMFGKLGLPAMGLVGIGWGTSIAYAVFLVIIIGFIYLVPYYKDFANFKLASSTQKYFGEILKMGLPMGMMYFNEVGYFLVLTLFMGKIGDTVLGAHQITIQYFWVVMTIVFCFNQAFSIRVGWRMGRQEPHWIKPIAYIGIGIIIIYLIFAGIFYWLFPHKLILFDFMRAPKPSTEFISTASSLFFYLALFQIMDGIRLTIFSILRGLKDTRFPLFTSLVSFWGIALPVGYYFSFIKNSNFAPGLWLGLVFGALVNIILLSLRLKSQIKIYNKKGRI